MSLIFTQAFCYFSFHFLWSYPLFSQPFELIVWLVNFHSSLKWPLQLHFPSLDAYIHVIKKYFLSLIVYSSTHKLLKVLTGFLWLISNFLFFIRDYDLLVFVFLWFPQTLQSSYICMLCRASWKSCQSLLHFMPCHPHQSLFVASFRANLCSVPRADDLPDRRWLTSRVGIGIPQKQILSKAAPFVLGPSPQFSFHLLELDWH